MLFSKPLVEVCEADLQALCDAGYPETDQVEYKEFLPGKNGPDGWHSGTKSITDHARNRLFEEVIAFANTRGGHLLVGIEESSDSPKRAVGLNPVPDCHELAKRLTQAAYECIDPPLSDLQVIGIPVGQGGQGVVVFRVRQSRSAPHRAKSDRHCYYRRGENTVALTMREIQDLTLNANRGLERVEERLAGFRKEFHARANLQAGSTSKAWVSYRVSSVPLIAFRLTPNDVRGTLIHRRAQFEVQYQRAERREIFVMPLGFNNRPVLRGTMIYNHTAGLRFEHSAYLDGSQSFISVSNLDLYINQERGVSLSQLLGAVASVLGISDQFAALSSMPAAEFAVEVEIISTAGAPNLYILAGTTHGWTLDREQLLLPQYSHVPELGPRELLSLVQADLFNSAGETFDDSIQSISPLS